ncbi:MAG: aminotransferase class III-fold pyridoxal phosphate-dependent enzyme [Planctomycetes bacterium]|nr:aminotransferase class III-fold pyridoxal phosphate-dependent enzyme [Planctomycetota bacterium]
MNELQAEAFYNDPRVLQAKQLLREALHEHSSELREHRSPVADNSAQYQQQLDDFKSSRGSALFYRYVGSGLGNGSLVELCDGSVKYDFISGIGVHGWGHSHPDLMEAGIDAAISDTVMQGNLQQIDQAQDVSALFLQGACSNGADLAHCFLTSSGAMANENAFKIAFQSRAPACRVLAFKHCFAGRTLGMAHVTDKAAYRDGIPVTLDVDYVPFFDHNDPLGSTERAVKVLQMHIQRYPKQHAVMILELIQGEGGYYPGSSDFFRALMNVLKENNILIHVDEIQTFGRCDTMFAFQHFGLDAYVDIVSVGKMSQVCATLYRADLQPRPGLISQTFTSSTAAVFAAQRILQRMLEPGFYGIDGQVMKVSTYFREQLQKIARDMPDKVEGPFGLGAMIAFTPLGGIRENALQFSKDLFEAGVMGFIAGNNPTRMRFLIPVAVVTEKDIDAASQIIRTLLEQS